MPAGFQSATGGINFGLGNIELAAKYRFLHQNTFGLDVAVFPRVFLPSGSDTIGDNHTSLLLPVWAEKDWEGDGRPSEAADVYSAKSALPISVWQVLFWRIS